MNDTEKYLPSYLPKSKNKKLVCSKDCDKIENELIRLRMLLVDVYKSYYKWQKHICGRRKY